VLNKINKLEKIRYSTSYLRVKYILIINGNTWENCDCNHVIGKKRPKMPSIARGDSAINHDYVTTDQDFLIKAAYLQLILTMALPGYTNSATLLNVC
jgi:hypothetical protein